MKTSAAPTARKATNITVDPALLAEAKALKINVSQASEDGLRRAVAAAQAERWLADNQVALESSNAFVEQNGLPLAGPATGDGHAVHGGRPCVDAESAGGDARR